MPFIRLIVPTPFGWRSKISFPPAIAAPLARQLHVHSTARSASTSAAGVQRARARDACTCARTWPRGRSAAGDGLRCEQRPCCQLDRGREEQTSAAAIPSTSRQRISEIESPRTRTSRCFRLQLFSVNAAELAISFARSQTSGDGWPRPPARWSSERRRRQKTLASRRQPTTRSTVGRRRRARGELWWRVVVQQVS